MRHTPTPPGAQMISPFGPIIEANRGRVQAKQFTAGSHMPADRGLFRFVDREGMGGAQGFVFLVLGHGEGQRVDGQ